MSEIFINLGVRYAAAFGSLAIGNEPRAVSVSNSGDSYGFEFYGVKDDNFENIAFQFDQNKVRFAQMPFTNNRESANILAPPPIISFSQDKDLIETPINGSDNIVVERWGTQPWKMRLRGLLIDVENRNYPTEAVKKLRRLFSYNGVVDCEGTQFDEKEILSMYFNGINIDPLQGFQDTVQFTLNATSISPVGFKLNDVN